MRTEIPAGQNPRIKNSFRESNSSNAAKIGNAFVIAAVFVGVWWIFGKATARHHRVKNLPLILPMQNSMPIHRDERNPSMMQAPWIFRNGYMGSGRFGDHRPDNAFPSPRPFPMYVANMDCRVGKYIISAREVIGNSGMQRLNYNIPPGQPRERLEKYQISLQIMSPDPDAIKNVKDFALHMTAVDNTGQKCTQLPPGNFPIVNFTSGMARIVSLSGPSPAATYLKEVQGEIVVDTGSDIGSGEQNSTLKTLKFTLHNIPLPVMNHIYGDINAAIVDSDTTQNTSAEPTAADKFRSRYDVGINSEELQYPHSPNGPLQLPIRLILQSGVRTEYSFYVNTEGRMQEIKCSFLTLADSDGAMRINADFTGPGNKNSAINKKFTAWMDEPYEISLPAQTLLGAVNYGKNIRLKMLFSLDADGVMPQPPSQTASTFLAAAGERGAVLDGAIKLNGISVHFGSVKMTIQKKNAQSLQGESKELNVLLDSKGHFKLANTAPGEYRLQIVSYEPVSNPLITRSPWGEYIKKRFGIVHPAWQNAVQDTVVHSGGYSSLLAWNLVEVKPVTPSLTALKPDKMD